MKDKVTVDEFKSTSIGAREWAKEFVRLYKFNVKEKRFPLWIEEDTMIGWFANAIRAGYDEGQRRQRHPLKEKEEKELREWLWLNHGHTSGLYGDDGEMQCHGVDFKRMDIKDIIRCSFIALTEVT